MCLRALWGGKLASCLNRDTNTHSLPAVRPQGPAAWDSGSRAVQQSHICFRRQPATLQLACHCGNHPKTTGPQRWHSEVNYRSVSSEPLHRPFTHLYLNDHLRSLTSAHPFTLCPCVLLSVSVHLLLCLWHAKRITVTLAAMSCLAGINRGTCKQKQDGTDAFCWSFLLENWADPLQHQRDTETKLVTYFLLFLIFCS